MHGATKLLQTHKHGVCEAAEGERGRQKEKQKHKIKGQCLNGIIAHSVDSVNSNTCKILAQKTANSTDTGADSTTTII